MYVFVVCFFCDLNISNQTIKIQKNKTNTHTRTHTHMLQQKQSEQINSTPTENTNQDKFFKQTTDLVNAITQMTAVITQKNMQAFQQNNTIDMQTTQQNRNNNNRDIQQLMI